jgi:uncharacterized integral membrane protein
MIRFLRLVFAAIVFVILLAFAFANRQWVTVSFDPFSAADSAALVLEVPLFVVVIGAAMLGVVAGAAATWVSQGRHRRAARRSRVEADRLRAEAEQLKAGRSGPAALPRA